MKSSSLNKLIDAFSLLDKESLNGDPMSFSGKIVVPLDDDYILKVMSKFDAIGDLQILEEAKKEGIDFYLPYQVLYDGTIYLIRQERIMTGELAQVELTDKDTTLNAWCPGKIKSEETIAYFVRRDYGEEMADKIRRFNKKYNIGNIYWHNVGFGKNGNIQCFDFQCGLARDKDGRRICTNKDV